MKPEKFKLKLLKIEQLSEDTKNFVFENKDDLEFKPGQYISMILDTQERKIRRPYSIASVPGKNMELCIKIIPNGLASPIINKLKIGDIIEFIGPMGEFIIENKDKNIIFIATGTGVAPFRSMINSLLENNFKKNITLIAGYRNNILYDEEFKELEEKYPNFNYKLAISSKGVRVQDKLVIDKNADYYLCGLSPMINSVRALLVKQGIKMSNIIIEKYD